MNTIVRNFNTLPSFFNEFFTDQNYLNAAITAPAANITESEEAFHIALAAPGFKKEDFKVEVLEKSLVVSLKSKSENETENTSEGVKYLRKEFSYGTFTRSFRLPTTVDLEHITATYQNGILELGIPKKEEAKPKEPRLLEIA
jgi:HSP20 family protein